MRVDNTQKTRGEAIAFLDSLIDIGTSLCATAEKGIREVPAALLAINVAGFFRFSRLECK
jgi:hypothetical protein